jgi:chromate transporter
MSRLPETSNVPTTGEPNAPQQMVHPSLSAIVSAFGFIGFTSFGGARAAYFRHAMVVSRRWLTDEQFLEGLTISQILPGPNISNLSVYLGQRLRGLTGAALAVIAVLLPGTVMIVALAIAYFGHGNLPGVPAVFKGVGAAAVGLSLATTLQVSIKGVHRWRDWLVVLITFLAVGFLRVSLLIPLLTIAPVSVWINRPRRQATSSAPAAPEETTS